MEIPYIETEDNTNENLHAFELVNGEWVSENTVLRKPQVSEASTITVKYLLKRGLPFQYNPTMSMAKRSNMMGINRLGIQAWKEKLQKGNWDQERKKDSLNGGAWVE